MVNDQDLRQHQRLNWRLSSQHRKPKSSIANFRHLRLPDGGIVLWLTWIPTNKTTHHRTSKLTIFSQKNSLRLPFLSPWRWCLPQRPRERLPFFRHPIPRSLMNPGWHKHTFGGSISVPRLVPRLGFLCHSPPLLGQRCLPIPSLPQPVHRFLFLLLLE